MCFPDKQTPNTIYKIRAPHGKPRTKDKFGAYFLQLTTLKMAGYWKNIENLIRICKIKIE